ncbi:ImmA/IrrE family metallo-endopeptidase [Paenibacillus rhizoplanae]|uniref:Helix-turn-helix domain-containing protein n=1 Tax=Paenibacillus rhizoplanae TaxID=1917181 RepID=A0ABW5FJ72_9BACL
MFIGENLTNLRIMHGYSRKQLSEMLDVTEQAIWQYENSYTSPKVQIVNELKRIFKVKSKYFYTRDMVSLYNVASNIEVMNIAYRSKIINTFSKTQSEVKHVEFLDAFVEQITAKISLPTLNIVQLRDEVVDYLNSTDDDRMIQINKMAQLARKKLGFSHDTNDELMYLIEKSGIFIFEKAIGEDIDAYSLWTQKNRAYIILGNIKQSAARRNFDLAHELGHLLLHFRVEFANLDRKEHKHFENEANLFAGAFLLPEKEFVKDITEVIAITNPDSYLDLKRKWKVSLQVLGYRAHKLGIFEAKDHRNFYAALHRKNYLKVEPLDKSIPLQNPMKIKTIIDFLAKRKLMDIRQMIEKDWTVEVSFFKQMTGIDGDFFDKYVSNMLEFDLQKVITIPNRNQ